MPACGGIIRDDKGTFIKGFYCKLGSCSPLIAEFRALLHGIEVTKCLALERVVFETDSTIVVNLISICSSINPQIQSLLGEISVLLQSSSWHTRVQHAFRESNKCADFLAQCGFDASMHVQLVYQ